MKAKEKKYVLLKKMSLLLIFLVTFISFFYFNLLEHISFENLKTHRHLILEWKQQHLGLTITGFSILYIIVVACSVPISAFMTLLGGFLFGPILGTILAVISATTGAFLIFFAIELAFKDWITQKAIRGINMMKQGFQENAFSYLLFLRFIPIFPFWLVNIVSALLAIPKCIFILATLIGTVPLSLIFTMIGNDLGTILEANDTPDLTILFKPKILFALLGLGLFALLPVIYKTLKRKKFLSKILY